MRLFLTTILTILCLLTVTAQDIIAKKDGDTLRVYDLKINAKFITYRERPGKDSPSKRIGKAKVLSVKKRNGKTITISAPDPEPEPANTVEVVVPSKKNRDEKKIEKPRTPLHEKPQGEVKRAVAADNMQLIEDYNKNCNGYGEKKQKKSKARCAAAIMNISTGSVLANEDIKIELLKCEQQSNTSIEYKIFVHNKTNNTIYLDLENCFRIYGDSTFKPYYSGKQIRQNKKSNKKVTYSNKIVTSRPQLTGRKRTTSYGTTHTYDEKKQTSQVIKEQKIITIPPKSKIALPPRISLDEYNEIVEEYDIFCTTLPRSQHPLHAWQIVNFDEQQTPYKNSFIITYSPNKKFETYSTVKFGLYLKQLIGLGTKFSRFNETLIHGYDRYTICGETYFK